MSEKTQFCSKALEILVPQQCSVTRSFVLPVLDFSNCVQSATGAELLVIWGAMVCKSSLSLLLLPVLITECQILKDIYSVALILFLVNPSLAKSDLSFLSTPALLLQCLLCFFSRGIFFCCFGKSSVIAQSHARSTVLYLFSSLASRILHPGNVGFPTGHYLYVIRKQQIGKVENRL